MGSFRKINLATLRRNLQNRIWETDDGELIKMDDLVPLHLENIKSLLLKKMDAFLKRPRVNKRQVIYTQYLNLLLKIKKEKFKLD